MCRDLWNWQTKNPDGYAGPFLGSDSDLKLVDAGESASSATAPIGVNGGAESAEVTAVESEETSRATNGTATQADEGTDVNEH